MGSSLCTETRVRQQDRDLTMPSIAAHRVHKTSYVDGGIDSQALVWATEQAADGNDNGTSRRLLLLPWLRQRTVSRSYCMTTLLSLPNVTERLIVYPSALDVAAICSMPCLMSLDLRFCFDGVKDAMIETISQHHPRLRKLLLYHSSVAQSSLNAFRHLEELDFTWCKNINSVDFSARTLRVLYASYSSVNDAGLRNAVHLEVLHVRDCHGVTTVASFATTLRELDASLGCGINDAGLVHATNLVSLNITENSKVTTLRPFCRGLFEFIANRESRIDDAALSEATNLVKLNLGYGSKISLVPPSVRELIALRDSGITNASLQNLTQLVKLDVSDNSRVTSLKPWAASLRSIVAHGKDCKLRNAAVAGATHLVELDAKDNVKVRMGSWVRNSKGYLQKQI